MEYEVGFYFKQGDDYEAIRETTKTDAEAFQKWAQTFEANRKTAEEIAKVIEGQKISVSAMTHSVMLQAEDKAAAKVLADLAKRNLLWKIKSVA